MDSLREALWSSDSPPGSEIARERVIGCATQELGAPDPIGRGRPGRRILAVAAGVLILLAATPQGRDAVSWAADLVGIGEVGGPPTSDTRPAEVPPASDQVVIASGKAPDGTPYEIVAYRTDIVAGESDPGTTCIFIDFPTTSGPSGGSCGDETLEGKSSLYVHQISAASKGERPANPFVAGYTSLDVTEVSVERANDGKPAIAAQLATLEGELQAKIGGDLAVGFFIAFLPTDFRIQELQSGQESLEVSAYDASGRLIDQVTRPDPETLRGAPRPNSSSQSSPLLQAADCPAIGRALEESGRPPDSLNVYGLTCPTLELLRWTLKHNPDVKEISLDRAAPVGD